ncbi:MAG: hypothetical protein KC931_09845, partial [Candidatus Omnitrophica bacterium]|nr:hypothetical protein [Candidatus Omnitrophota bacterium]
VFLFLGAIRNWKRISGDREVSLNRSEAKGVFGFIHWLKRGRRHHGPFSVGWRTFRDLEEREVYRRWRPGKRVGLLLIPMVALVVALGGFPVLVGVTLLSGVAILVATAGFSSTSLKREIQRGTSVFLLTSPIDPTDIILGKWFFYMRQGFAVWSIGVLATLGAWLLTVLGVSPIGEFEMTSAPLWVLVAYVSILCFIPFLSIFRLAENVRLYPQFLSYLVLVGLLCCAPLGLMVGSIMIGAGLVDVSPKALRNRPRARIPVVLLGWTCFLGCLSNVFLFPFAFSSYSPLFYPAVLTFDLTLLPLSAGLYLWILFSEKGDAWWRKHLLS